MSRENLKHALELKNLSMAFRLYTPRMTVLFFEFGGPSGDGRIFIKMDGQPHDMIDNVKETDFVKTCYKWIEEAWEDFWPQKQEQIPGVVLRAAK